MGLYPVRGREIGNSFPLLEGRVEWDIETDFFGEVCPKKPHEKPQVISQIFPYPQVRFPLGIHSMDLSPAPAEGFILMELGRVTLSSSDPENLDFGSRSSSLVTFAPPRRGSFIPGGIKKSGIMERVDMGRT